MYGGKDVDDVILDHARSLLPYITLPARSVVGLEDVPPLFVRLFEMLMTEPIPNDQKPFRTATEQAYTLQTIIDTLEQTLGLPMSHISGSGLARLDRRQLSDALQIFDDLIKHCYHNEGNQFETLPSDSRLTLSQLASPRWMSRDAESGQSEDTRTPQLVNARPECRGLQSNNYLGSAKHDHVFERPTRDDTRISPFATVQPIQQKGIDIQTKNSKIIRSEQIFPNKTGIEPAKPDGNSFASSKSSITLLKEIYNGGAGAKSGDISNTKSNRKPVASKPTQKSQCQIFDICLPSLSLFSPKNKSKNESRPVPRHDKENINEEKERIHSFKDTHDIRFEPYKKPSVKFKKYNNDVTKKHELAPVKLAGERKSSVKPTKGSRGKHCSVISPTHSPKIYRSKPVGKESQRVIVSRRPSYAKPTISSLGYRNKGDTSKESKKPPQPTVRKPSVKSLSQIRPKSTQRRNHRHLSDGNKRQTACATRQLQAEDVSRGIASIPAPVSPLEVRDSHAHKRQPSVVSTKVRKHSTNSSGSPIILRTKRPVRRGDTSPKTSSLCSSIKLLQEFDYVKRRLKQIQTQKQEFLDAMQQLDEEELRLEYVLTHVHEHSNRTAARVNVHVSASKGAV